MFKITKLLLLSLVLMPMVSISSEKDANQSKPWYIKKMPLLTALATATVFGALTYHTNVQANTTSGRNAFRTVTASFLGGIAGYGTGTDWKIIETGVKTKKVAKATAFVLTPLVAGTTFGYLGAKYGPSYQWYGTTVSSILSLFLAVQFVDYLAACK